MTAPAPAPPRRKSWVARNLLWLVPGGLGLVVLLCGGFVLGVVSFVFGLLKGSEPYATSLETVRTHPAAVAALGEPVQAGWVVTGNLNYNGGNGSADLSYPVTGPAGSGWVRVTATKADGAWATTSLTLTPDGGDGMDLLAAE